MKDLNKFLLICISKKSLEIIALLFLAFLWTSLTTIYWVHQWSWGSGRRIYPTMAIAQLVSIPLLAFIIYVTIRARSLTSNHTGLVKFGLFYVVVNAVIFFSVAPGCFTEDTYYTYHMVKNGWWEAWYSPLHPIFAMAVLQIIPWYAFAPGIFLILLWSGAYVLMHHILLRLTTRRWVHLIVPLTLWMPAHNWRLPWFWSGIVISQRCSSFFFYSSFIHCR